MMDAIQKKLLEQVADLHDVPQGAYSLRINGNLYGKNDSENITIVAKTDKQGIDIYVKPGTKNESLHIPVLLAQSGLKELVYNDFHIGADCDVTIVAGCGIHNSGSDESEHSGIHAFYLEEGARVKYVEKHYGQGEGTGERVLNPTTEIEIAEEDMAEYSRISTDVSTYQSEMRAKFVSGEVDIDAEFDNYIQGLKDRGVETMIEMKPKALDKFNAQ